jgi:hypothetical protein
MNLIMPLDCGANYEYDHHFLGTWRLWQVPAQVEENRIGTDSRMETGE